LESEFDKFPDLEVRQRGMQLRGRCRGGESLDKILQKRSAWYA